VKYSHWTTTERRQLTEMHHERFPTHAELQAALPRHTVNSILTTAYALGVRVRGIRAGRRGRAYWLAVSHRHFAQREAEMRA